MNSMRSIVLLIAIFVLMYFLLIRPQKKKEKAHKQMQREIKAGDEVTTIGGICGKVVKAKEESLVIQVGADRVKFEVMRWAISAIGTPVSKTVSSDDKSDENDSPEIKKPKRLGKKSEDSQEEA